MTWIEWVFIMSARNTMSNVGVKRVKSAADISRFEASYKFLLAHGPEYEHHHRPPGAK